MTTQPVSPTRPAIRIENARSHNLAGVDCEIPLGSLTVITGVSGSGKSTLAFDTLYAEGQRRYVTSLSTYARQFLERLPRPEVDFISHLPPAIAIERRNRVTNARSTVGTATEILDHLRLLYAHAGTMECPRCEVPVQPGDVGAVSQRVADRFAGQAVTIGAALAKREGETPAAQRDRLAREGYTRLLDAEGGISDLSELSAREFSAARRDGLLVIDRLAVRDGPGEAARLSDAIHQGFAWGDGTCHVVSRDRDRARYRNAFACDTCGDTFAEPTPALFSFNSALGACEACEGFGRVPGLDRERVIPDPSKSLAEGAVAPFQTPGGRRAHERLLAACEDAGVPIDVPVDELDPDTRDWLFTGDELWGGIRGFFVRLERKRYKVQARVMIARYRRFDPCPDCDGTRLCEAARAVSLAGRDITEMLALPLAELADTLENLSLPPAAEERIVRVLADLRARVATAVEAGLGYITLDRPVRTLSGGETQRIQLAAALGGTLTASLYVLDEPSVGLHARDVARLIGILQRVRDQGNTVVVVEHAPEVVAAADHVIDLGPGAGHRGGRVMAEGPVAVVRDAAESLTGRALRGDFDLVDREPRPATGKLEIRGACENNLRDLDVTVPLGQLVAFSGVSGAGKTTLVRSVLVGQLRREPDRGACAAVLGGEALEEVVLVEPEPPSKSPRSNAATVTGAFDPIRKRFSETREAKAHGAGPGWFSFNVAGGRCETCEGSGELVVDMQFLDDVRMPCDQCLGTRYRAEARQLTWKGLSIVDVLGLSVDEAVARFHDERAIVTRLTPLVDVGLGYLSLGQPLSTLSGGEAQRLRLAQALADGKPGTLYVFDEPTMGLHPADVERLLGCFEQLLDRGASIVVTEHHTAVLRRADHLIDLGPGGGPEGGKLLYAGAPADYRDDRSPTARALHG
ncbi:MAG: excinuclease ABC subunit UvrA [Myxococcota bacterium]